MDIAKGILSLNKLSSASLYIKNSLKVGEIPLTRPVQEIQASCRVKISIQSDRKVRLEMEGV